MHARLKIRALSPAATLQIDRVRRNERGIQLVELAIVIPIFVLLFGAKRVW